MKAIQAAPDEEKKAARQVKRSASLHPANEPEPAGPPAAKKPKGQRTGTANPQAGQLLDLIHRTDEDMMQRPAQPVEASPAQDAVEVQSAEEKDMGCSEDEEDEDEDEEESEEEEKTTDAVMEDKEEEPKETKKPEEPEPKEPKEHKEPEQDSQASDAKGNKKRKLKGKKQKTEPEPQHEPHAPAASASSITTPTQHDSTTQASSSTVVEGEKVD